MRLPNSGDVCLICPGRVIDGIAPMSSSKQQLAKASLPDSTVGATGNTLTLDEMTRVMDVARTLRKERSIAERELNREETIRLLRLKLREAADLAGDPVTDQQIEVAIEHYFANLHEFDPPDTSWETTLAHFYVRRNQILGWGLALAAAGLLTWGWWFSGLMPSARRTEMRAQQTYAEVQEVAGAIEVLTENPELTSGIESARSEASSYLDRGDVSQLEQLRDRLLLQETVLKDEYRLMIVTGEQSGVDRYVGQDAAVSGYYLIVEAVDSNGKPVAMQVRNGETGKFERVTKWAEQVPQEVYEQVRDDKQADGIVDTREFAVKRRGELDVKISLTGPDGQIFERGRQITEW